MTDERLAMFDRMSCDEIIIALGQDPAFTLPLYCRHWRRRMDEARSELRHLRETTKAGKCERMNERPALAA